MWVPKATHICQIKNQLYVVIKKLIDVACKCSFTKKKKKKKKKQNLSMVLQIIQILSNFTNLRNLIARN